MRSSLFVAEPIIAQRDKAPLGTWVSATDRIWHL